jgi:V/A-type H+-transporting ATPase subunit F
LIASLTEDSLQTIILIPGVKGSMGIALQGVKNSVERAVGADILFKD